MKTPDRTISEQEKKVPEPLSTQKREKYLKKIREAVEDSNSDTGVNWNEEFQSILSKPVEFSIELIINYSLFLEDFNFFGAVNQSHRNSIAQFTVCEIGEPNWKSYYR